MQTILIALTVYIISYVALILLTKWIYKADEVPPPFIVFMMVPGANTILLGFELAALMCIAAYTFTKRLLK